MRRSGWGGAVALWLAAVGVAAAQSSPVRSETVAVESDPAATRQLRSVLDQLAAEDWETAAEALERFEARFADALVDVEPRRVLRGLVAAQVLRNQWPAAGDVRQRQRLDPLAEQRFEISRQTDDDEGLLWIVERASASRFGGAAAALLAQRSWERGELDRATAFWSLLRSDPADEIIDPAALLRMASPRLSDAERAARALLAELFDGDVVRARRLWARFREEFPAAIGELAGRSGALAEILHAELAAADAFSRSQRSPAVGVAAPSAVPARAARNLCQGSDFEWLGLAWRTPVPAALPGRRWTAQPLLWRVPPRITPAVEETGLFVQDANELRGLRWEDGGPLWPSGAESDRGVLARTGSETAAELPLLGEPRWAPTLSGGRLYVVAGSPVAYRAKAEPRALLTRLECFDVRRQEGKLLWTRSPQEVFPDANWQFSGPPLAVEERVFVAARRSEAEVAVGVACLEGASGELVWFRPVCGLLVSPPPTAHVVASDMLTCSFDRLILAGDFGATICLAQAGGEIEWISRDAPLPWRPPGTVPAVETPGRPAVMHRGRVHSVQQDDRTLQQLDAVTGVRLWRRDLGWRVSHVAGVRGGVVVVAGQKLAGVDFDSGALLWTFGFEDPAGSIIGEPLLAGETVYACTREELFGVDLSSGAIVRRVPLWAAYGVRGGTLLRGPGRVLVVSNEELAAFATRP